MNNHILLPDCSRNSDPHDLFKLLCAIRSFEESLLQMVTSGLLGGTTHTCLGQEATAVGVLSALDKDRDVVFSNHRCHGHFLAYCGEVERLYLEIMGKPDGICAGRGGSQHLYHRNFHSNGVQGGIVPVLMGMALAEKLKKSKAIGVVFMGDGTLGEGVVYESLNIAALWHLPVLFVLELNGYAQSTPSALQMTGEPTVRMEAFGIYVRKEHSTDVSVLLKAAATLVDMVRDESRPCCLAVEAYRLGPHSKGDDYRDRSEVELARQQDPLRVASAQLGEDSSAHLASEASELVTKARERALAAPGYERTQP